MKKKRESPQKNKKAALFKIAALVTVVLVGVALVSFSVQTKKYLIVDLFITGGEWWWDTARPPFWIGTAVSPGIVEYDMKGDRVVEVLEVQQYDQGARKAMMVKAKLMVSKNIRTQKYRFKQNPLEIGSTIVIEPGSVQMYANVIGIQGVQEKKPLQKMTVATRWNNVYPWQADAINIGDIMEVGSNQEVARVISKEVRNTEKTIIDEGTFGQLIVAKEDPFRRDVFLTFEILTTQWGNQRFFGYSQIIKVGEYLFMSFPKVLVSAQIISFEE